jgi:uncharacterized membrane protein SpoIIM required for sporulation
MKQAEFERRGEPLWQAFAEELAALEANRKNTPSPQFAHNYRQICQAHALCEHRQYTGQLEMQLADLVVRGQRYLYRRPTRFLQAFWRFVISGFPAAVRKEARLFALVSALFYLPAIGLACALSYQPDLIYSLMPPQGVQHLESMYQPDNVTLGEARDSGTNWEMFGFYIRNNIGVAFRTCASGLLFGVGSLLLVLYNGLLLGGAAAHLTHLGYSQTFFTFVIGHGSFELTAIVIAGVAGLKLGLALVAPGRFSRLVALRRAGGQAIVLAMGAGLMLVVAAFIEAFWSSNNLLVPSLKYSFGALGWVFVGAYLLLAGRRRGA